MAGRNINKPSPNKNIFKFSSKKNQATILCEGSLEFDACFFFEYLDPVISYEHQPDVYKYQYNEKSVNFYPDFKLSLDSGEIILVEIKPLNRACKNEFKEKFSARKSALKELGYNFILLTDNQIRSAPLLDNLKLLYEEKNIDRQLNEIETDALVFLSENTSSSLQELSRGLEIKDSYLKRNIVVVS